MYYLRAAFLAPGIALHEFAHHLFCILSGVKVRQAVYFRLGTPAGFVIHEEPELYRQIFAIVAGPLVVNSAAALLAFNLALRQAARAADPLGWAVALTLLGLGLSAAPQAFPSRTDGSNLVHSSNRHLLKGNLVALLGYPAALHIALVHLLRPLGSEWLYSLGLFYLALQGFIAVS